VGSYEFFVQIRDGEHVILDTNLSGAGTWLRWLAGQPPEGRVNEFEAKFVSGAALAEAFTATDGRVSHHVGPSRNTTEARKVASLFDPDETYEAIVFEGGGPWVSEPRPSTTDDKPATGQVQRTYLAAKGRGGISVLYMVEEGPDSLRDLVLHESGWVRTSTLADWRFGERSDIDEITREEARWFAESVGLGQFVK
jgi:hypothetical protein